jgi:hypothetical protein
MKGMIYRDLLDRYRVIEGGSSSHPLDWDTDTVSLSCRGSRIPMWSRPLTWQGGESEASFCQDRELLLAGDSQPQAYSFFRMLSFGSIGFKMH